MRTASLGLSALVLVGCAAGDDGSSVAGGDSGRPDTALQDSGSDTSTMDSTAADAADSTLDAAAEATPDAPADVTPDTPAETLAADTMADATDAAGATDAADAADAADAPLGPATPGTYVYTAVPQYVLTNPPTLAWHPSGAYALVLNENDAVYSYAAATKALTKVGSAGASVSWRAIAFTPDGSKAVLLGNTSAPQGQLWLWDHATSTLAQVTTASYAGGTYESIAFRADGAGKVLGSRAASGAGYIATLLDWTAAAGLGAPSAKNTSAGCQDLAWATDAFGAPAVAVVCGVNGVTLLHVDGGGVWNVASTSGGNTSRISARPQGDYALAVGWSGAKLYRFQTGAWNTDYGNPAVNGAFQIAFATDGRRALVLGGTFGGVGQVYEFRHDLFTQSEIGDVSIPGFTAAPYNADSGTKLNDAAWRPGCEGGLLVAGEDTLSAKKGMLVRFEVSGGAACP